VVAEQHDGITVPLSAVQHGQSNPYVFIVQPDDSARIRPVTVDQTFNGRALIDQGLHAGDTVVTAGQYRLDEGVKVASVSAGDPRVQNTTQASAGML
jgi:multidrug efflux system membrane fusion protein